MSEITLDAVLEAKEARVVRRIRMQVGNPGTCISLSLNIPGPKKDSPQIRALFRHALERVEAVLPVSASHITYEKTGPHALMVVDTDAAKVKDIACRLETEKEYSRLLDIDVYSASGAAVASAARSAGRSCFLCQNSAVVCMREQRHSPLELSEEVERLFVSFQVDISRAISEQAAYYASLGLEAMLYEAASSPAPGLVDPFHAGSHKDMDFFTFQKSSAALAFSLARCAEAGIRHAGEAEALLPVLRRIGVEAEKDMFRATEGVNTQKGLLFSMGLALGAAGLLVREGRAVTAEALCKVLQKMARGIIARELGRNTPRTAGERMFREFGISGIRGEVEAGLPSVRNAGLPTLEGAIARGEDCNRALIRTLIALMAEVDDTTILARSPKLESLRMVQREARELHHSGILDQENWRDALWELDAKLISHNLSPGGSADLLALTWFMYRAENSTRSYRKAGAK